MLLVRQSDLSMIYYVSDPTLQLADGLAVSRWRPAQVAKMITPCMRSAFWNCMMNAARSVSVFHQARIVESGGGGSGMRTSRFASQSSARESKHDEGQGRPTRRIT